MRRYSGGGLMPQHWEHRRYELALEAQNKRRGNRQDETPRQ